MNAESVSNFLQLSAARIGRRVQGFDLVQGLSPARMSVLSQLLRDGPQTPSGLARIEGVRPPTMTLLLRSLKEQGLVLRRTDKSDRRSARIQITAKGKRVFQRGLKRRELMVAGLLKGLNQAEIRAIERAARILEDNLNR